MTDNKDSVPDWVPVAAQWGSFIVAALALGYSA